MNASKKIYVGTDAQGLFQIYSVSHVGSLSAVRTFTGSTFGPADVLSAKEWRKFRRAHPGGLKPRAETEADYVRSAARVIP